MDITTARNEIDRIDEQITALFCQRMACSAAIGAYKAENALPIYVPSREEEILEKLQSEFNLREKVAVHIVDLIPQDLADMRLIFAKEPGQIDKEEMEKILEFLEQYTIEE